MDEAPRVIGAHLGRTKDQNCVDVLVDLCTGDDLATSLEQKKFTISQDWTVLNFQKHLEKNLTTDNVALFVKNQDSDGFTDFRTLPLERSIRQIHEQFQNKADDILHLKALISAQQEQDLRFSSHAFEQRKATAKHLLEASPELLPVIVGPRENAPPAQKNKFTFKLSMMMSELKLVIEQYIPDLTSRDHLFFYVKTPTPGKMALIADEKNLSEIYQQYKSEDLFLYIYYSLQDDFQDWWKSTENLRALTLCKWVYFYNVDWWEKLTNQVYELPLCDNETQADYTKRVYQNALQVGETIVRNEISQQFTCINDDHVLPDEHSFVKWFGPLLVGLSPEEQAQHPFPSPETVKGSLGTAAILAPTLTIGGGLLGLALGVTGFVSGGFALGIGIPIVYGVFQESKQYYDEKTRSSRADQWTPTTIKTDVLNFLRDTIQFSSFCLAIDSFSTPYWRAFKQLLVESQAESRVWESLLKEWPSQWIFKEITVGPQMNEVVCYIVKIAVFQNDIEDVEIVKRYSKFRELYDQLCQTFTFKLLDEFPPKTWSSSGGTEREFLEGRRAAFQIMMTEISRNWQMCTHSAVLEFLGLV